MKLTCEALPPVEDVTEADILRIIGGGLFGRYAHLRGEAEGLIQVGYGGRPAPWAFEYAPGTWERDFAEGCKAFTERTGSERWTLDHYDPATRENHVADGDRTLAEVTQAFLEYLRGDDAWRARYTWAPASSKRGRLPEIPR